MSTTEKKSIKDQEGVLSSRVNSEASVATLYQNEHAIRETIRPDERKNSIKSDQTMTKQDKDMSVFEKDVEKISIELPPVSDLQDEEPDGGYGWFVVLGSFFVQLTSFGVTSSWGVMQNFLKSNVFNHDPQALVTLSFVGSLAIAFCYGAGPVVQACNARFGLRPVMIAGTLLITLGLEMSGFATQVWHLYITQGVIFGSGAACMYCSVMSVTVQWFTKKRGIAMGIIAAGSGIGGLIVPFIVTPINARLGYAWTYRILGFVCLVCDVIACIFVKERIQRPREKKRLSQIIKFDSLKNSNFLIFCLAADLNVLGSFIPLFYVPAYATSLGLTTSQGSSLVSVIAALNCTGRLIVGVLADRIGHLNANIVFTIFPTIACLLIWTFAYSYASLIGFAVVFGFGCGSYLALMSSISANILGMEKFPSGLSLLLFLNMIPVFGTNVASAIDSAVHSKDYLTYKLFAGLPYLISLILLLWLKWRMNRHPLAKV